MYILDCCQNFAIQSWGGKGFIIIYVLYHAVPE